MHLIYRFKCCTGVCFNQENGLKRFLIDKGVLKTYEDILYAIIAIVDIVLKSWKDYKVENI
jgi:hypothetical protein